MKKSIIVVSTVLGVFWMSLVFADPRSKCPPDSVEVGPTCVDKYEGSLWNIPPANKRLIEKIKKGKATLDDLIAGGATQHGCDESPYNHAPFPPTFPLDGNWTAPLYAVSVPGVLPTACISWLQAEQACALSGKGLLTNQEWQRAAASTPDGLPCNIGHNGPVLTGTAGCVSVWGTFDMVGNVLEWAAEWVPMSTFPCGHWDFSDDEQCLVGALTTGSPGALLRGGTFDSGPFAGVLNINAGHPPTASGSIKLGFRCGRPVR
jgi:formylglycine-generating enzyme required for sulfatase activity